MKNITFLLFTSFLFFCTKINAQESPSETLVSNLWRLDYLVVEGETVLFPDVIHITDRQEIENKVMLVITPESGETYKVESQFNFGSSTGYYLVENNNN